MCGKTLTPQEADESMLPYIESLLEASALPTDDIREQRGWFYVGYDGRNRVGIGGIESSGTAGLLRSLVVEPSVRGNGYGTAMCEKLEAQARITGIETLYLLTTTAAAFFDARGYTPIERAEAPSSIQQTTEFADLCPATATCMKKSL